MQAYRETYYDDDVALHTGFIHLHLIGGFGVSTF
jgi:hypothetical protein